MGARSARLRSSLPQPSQACRGRDFTQLSSVQWALKKMRSRMRRATVELAEFPGSLQVAAIRLDPAIGELCVFPSYG